MAAPGCPLRLRYSRYGHSIAAGRELQAISYKAHPLGLRHEVWLQGLPQEADQRVRNGYGSRRGRPCFKAW